MTVLVPSGELDALLLYQSHRLLFSPLIHGDGVQGRPGVAESWERASESRIWTVHMRDDVRWHDGVAVTAHDVVFTVELFGHPDVLFPVCGAGVASSMDSLWAPDDHTLMLSLKRPPSPGVDRPLGACPIILPRHLLQALDPGGFTEWDFWTRPVGYGPYRFVRRVPQTMFELEANVDFYGGEPSIQRVILKLSTASPIVELRSGGADVALFVGPTEVLKLEADSRFVVHHRYEWSQLIGIYWNQHHPLLADAVVRKALSHAIDRRQLARLLNYPDEMPLVGGVSNQDLKDRPYRQGTLDQGPSYDPALAERLLELAGWIDRDGNGIREHASQEARFTLSVISGGDHRGREQGIFVQDQLRRVGVAVEIRPLVFGAAQDALRLGDYDAIINLVNNEPARILVEWLGEPHPEGLDRWLGEPSPFGYRSQEAARLLRALHGERDLNAQDTLYRQVNEIFHREMPVTFLFPVVESHVAHRRIRGFHPGWYLLEFAEELWIDDGGELEDVSR